MLGVFADPIYFGDYPASVKQRISVLQPISSELVCLLRTCSAAQAPQLVSYDFGRSKMIWRANAGPRSERLH